MNDNPTPKQLASICMSYRHDFGLMTEEQKKTIIVEAKSWWNAIYKELESPSNHPLVNSIAENLK